MSRKTTAPEGTKRSALDRAQDVLGMDPLPSDAERQIDALYRSATPDERTLFSWIYEGLFVARHAEKPNEQTWARERIGNETITGTEVTWPDAR
jgi:hypothetical protein